MSPRTPRNDKATKSAAASLSNAGSGSGAGSRAASGSTSRSVSSSPARLFYALWPDATTRDALTALQGPVRGRKVVPANLHLTLAFLGSQPRASLPLLDSLLDKLPDQRFMLAIDSYGYFSKARIAWAGPSSTPDALLWIYNALVNALDEAQVAFKSATGFRPHVTLARDAEPVDREPPLRPAVSWPISTIALVESVPVPGGVHYELLATRSLA